MANGLSWEEAAGGVPTATPAAAPSSGGGLSWEEASGGTPPPAQPAPSRTPATDQATQSSQGLFDYLFRRQDPTVAMLRQHAWPGPAGESIPAEQGPKNWNELMEISGRPVGGPMTRYSEEAYRRNSPLAAIWPKPPWAIQTLGGAYNAAAGLSDFVTSPRGLAELAATAATGGAAGLPFLGAEVGPHLKEQLPQIYKAATGQLSPMEAAEVGTGLGLIALPVGHAIGRRFAPPEFRPALPSPPGTVYGPLPFERQPEVPPPIPSRYARPLEKPPGEEVGPIVEQRPAEAAKPEEKPISKEELKTAVEEAEKPAEAPAAEAEPVKPITPAQYKHLNRKANAGHALTEQERQQVLDYEAKPPETGAAPEEPVTAAPEVKAKPGEAPPIQTGTFDFGYGPVEEKPAAPVGLYQVRESAGDPGYFEIVDDKGKIESRNWPTKEGAQDTADTLNARIERLPSGELAVTDRGVAAAKPLEPLAASKARAIDEWDKGLAEGDITQAQHDDAVAKINRGEMPSLPGQQLEKPGEPPVLEGEFIKLTPRQQEIQQRQKALEDWKAQPENKGKALPIEQTMPLQELQKAEAAAKPSEQAAAPVGPTEAQKAEIAQIRADVADAQNVVRSYVQNPPVTPEEHYEFGKAQEKVLSEWNKIHQIREQSGKRREFVLIGTGASSLQAANFGGYEGLDTVAISPGKSQAYHSREIVNVGAAREGITGQRFFREAEMSARMAGTQIIPGEVVDLKYANGKNGESGIDVYVGVRTGKGPKDYRVTQVVPAWEVGIGTGSSQVVVPYPGYELTGWGSSDNLILKSRGGTAVVYGRGNAATQGILSALGDKRGPKKVISVARSDFFKESEASDDQLQRLKAYAREGRVQFVTGSLDAPGGVSEGPGGTRIVKVGPSKANPKADYTFDVNHVENFLLSKNNTDWATSIPELKFEPMKRRGAPVLDKTTGKPAAPFIKVLGPGSHRTNMENVYVMGDVRESLPSEKRGRRIKTAQGDAGSVAVDVQERIALRRNKEPLDPWTDQKPADEPIDQRLKTILKHTTPEDIPHGVGSIYEAPTRFWEPGTEYRGVEKIVGGKKIYVSAKTGLPAMTGGKPVPPSKAPPGKTNLPPPPHPPRSHIDTSGALLSAQQQQQQERARFYVVPGAGRPPEVRVAQDIAEEQHKGQKYADRPYIEHVQEVVDAVRPELKPAAYLHDVIEDHPTSVTPRKLAEQGVSNRTIDTVQTLTRRPSETYANYIDRVAIEPDAREIKMADLRANLRTLPEDSTLRPRYTKALDKLQDAENIASNPRVVQAEADARVAANPNYADKLVTDINSGKKGTLDLADETVLTQKRGTFQAAKEAAGRKMADINAPNNERKTALSNFEDMDARSRELDHATDGGDIFKGRKQRLQWHQFRAKDYALPAMEQKLVAAKHGEPVTPAERADLKTKTDKLSNAMVDVENAKIASGWRPGLGKNVAPGLRHKQHVAQQAKDALDNTIFKEVLKNKTRLEKGVYYYRNIAGVSRAIMTADYTSALLRQGGLLFFGDPRRSFRIMGDVVRASKSDESYFTLMQDIRERPNAELYVQSKLGLTDIKSPKMENLEEAYMSQWTDKIPILNHSQRAYVYFLNRLRADTFDIMSDKLGRAGNVTVEQAKGISNFINVFTGRGRIPGQYAGAIAGLNELFFAPRYVLSRFQAVTFQPLRYAKDPAVRKLIATEYAKTLIGYGIVYGLVSTAGQAAGVTVEKNPLSSDFGKIKIGNTRIDLLSGVAQTLTFLGRTLLAHTKTEAGQIEKLYGTRAFTARKYGDVLWKFVWSKFAPVPASFVNAMGREKVTGEKTTPLAEAAGLVLPMNGNDILKAMIAQGVPFAVAAAILTNFGVSVNTYAQHVHTRQRKQHRAR